MKRIYTLSTMMLISLAFACGSATEKKESKEHTEGMEHHDHGDDAQAHDHAAMEAETTSSSDVPAVPAEAKVFFKNLENGQTVSSPVKLEFGVEGMEVEPAGEVHAGKGHHHIIIDGSFLPTGTVVPADSVNIHYGKGQTETEVELSAGKHTLTMQFADGYHRSYGEQLSTTIEITVE